MPSLGVRATLRTVLLLAFAVVRTSAAFLQPVHPEGSLVLGRRQSRRQSLSASKITPQASEESKSKSNVLSTNFWYSVVRKDDGGDDENDSDNDDPEGNQNNGIVSSRGSKKDQLQQPRRIRIPPLPCVPTLDSDGLLPPSAYFQSAPDAKPTSRIQIAWDVADLPRLDAVEITTRDISDMVSTMQSAMDHGMTTFQLKAGSQRRWAETNLFASLIRDTPATVLQQHCHLIVPLYLQDAMDGSVTRGSTVSPKSVRTAVVERLGRMGTDCADNIQIQFPVDATTAGPRIASNSNSVDRMTKADDNASYYLDLLDGLQELQRDGLILSVSARNVPEQFLRKAQDVGFGNLISTNQVDANLLDPAALRATMIPDRFALPKDQRPWTVVANALAGGWLTDRYLDTNPRQPPTAAWLRSLSLQERCNWENAVVQVWGEKHVKVQSNKREFRSVWEAYHSRLLLPLQQIARKHSVSVASVVLRWTLQQEGVAGTVVACRLLPEHHYWDRKSSGTSRSRQLREVVCFELDAEDMERLWELSGRTEELPNEDFHEQDWLESDDGMVAASNGVWIPSGRKYY